MLRARVLTILASALAATAAVVPVAHADVPAGASWTEATITSADGTKLHADVLRPKDLPATAKTPVILSIGPYFNHSGQTGPAGPVEDTPYDPVLPTGPSTRFADFIKDGHLMERGYTYVMVDLRGFGGSNGCLDWAGPGEQGDVRAAVEWAARQSWSSGRVGMYGKSYDGVTGLIGAEQHPDGLAAVVAGEPVYDMYRYLYSNGVRFENALATPALYDAIALTPGPLADDPAYNLNGATDPACLATNWASQQNSDHAAPYWRARDLIARAHTITTPLFMTQGFIENNTKPDGSFDFFSAVAGPKRAWFGMWDHVRGNDVDADKRLKMGRKGWFDEVMRFYDHYVRDVPLADAPTDKDPPVVVQTNDGTWRGEAAWPPADAKALTSTLRTGTYVDDGNNSGTGSGGGLGIWTVSAPLANEAHLAGIPHVDLDVVTQAPAANLVVDVYDIDKASKATLISRGATLVNRGGPVSLDLYGDDWRLPAGHRVGVLVTSSNSEWWLHVPTQQTVGIVGGKISLPFLTEEPGARIQGDPAVKLEDYLNVAPFAVADNVIAAGTSRAFALPAPMVARSSAAPAAAPAASVKKAKKAAPRLRARIAAARGAVVVYGNAPRGARVTVALRRAGHVVARRTVRARYGAFRVRFAVKRAGSYRATAIARRGTLVLRAKTTVRRVKTA